MTAAMTADTASDTASAAASYRRRAARPAAVLLSAALVAVACTTDPEEPPPGGGGTGSLSGVCPDPIVAQASWWPEAESGALYHLLGDEYQIDTEQKRVSGPLLSSGVETGVEIEIRAGGPATGFQLSSAMLHTDDAITLAEVNTDEVVSAAAVAPVLSVVSVHDIFPIAIMWDPQTYPEFETVNDIGATDTTVLAFGDSPYLEYLIGSGILQREQVDTSYDGTPSRWLAEDGAIAQESFATTSPYVYEHEVDGWNQPIRLQLIYDLGYRPYYTLAIRADQKGDLAGCLEQLVPIVQQSQLDYLADPAATNELIVELVDEYGGFPYSYGRAEFSVAQMRSLGVVGNGHNATVGDFDLDRVEELLGIVLPIHQTRGSEVPGDLTAADIATNEFIDPDIGLP